MGDRDHRQERGDLVHKHCRHCDPKDWVIHADDVPAWLQDGVRPMKRGGRR